jgi:hypothetical protein
MERWRLDNAAQSDDRFSIFLRQMDEQRSLERRSKKKFVFYKEEEEDAWQSHFRSRDDQQVREGLFAREQPGGLRRCASLPLLPLLTPVSMLKGLSFVPPRIRLNKLACLSLKNILSKQLLLQAWQDPTRVVELVGRLLPCLQILDEA